MPVFDMLERMIRKRFNFRDGFCLRFITRSAYVGEFNSYIKQTLERKEEQKTNY